MRIIEIAALSNGAHRNQATENDIILLDGWAVIPDDMTVPASFPFVNIEVDEVEYTREPTIPGDEPETYTIMTVMSMTEGTLPEPVEPDHTITQLDRVEAQATYTAMMTDTLLEV